MARSPDHRNMQVVSGLHAPCPAERISGLLDKSRRDILQSGVFLNDVD
jgi:hypothetical protein